MNLDSTDAVSNFCVIANNIIYCNGSSCSDSIQPWATSTITADPKLTDPTTGNLQIGLGSSALNTGNSSYISDAGISDMAGNPRSVGGQISIGAYQNIGTGSKTYYDCSNGCSGSTLSTKPIISSFDLAFCHGICQIMS